MCKIFDGNVKNFRAFNVLVISVILQMGNTLARVSLAHFTEYTIFFLENWSFE